MYYIVESKKSFDQAVDDLSDAIKKHGFGVLHIHDLGNTLRGKGVDFEEECKVFEVCNPGQAAKVLAADMRLNMVLPCRISVYTEASKTKLGLVSPEQMLSTLSNDDELLQTAKEVEDKVKKMVEDSK